MRICTFYEIVALKEFLSRYVIGKNSNGTSTTEKKVKTESRETTKTVTSHTVE